MTDQHNVTKIKFSGKKVYKASRALQAKSGFGKVDAKKVDAAREAVQEANYWPFAAERIAVMGQLVKEARAGGDYEHFTQELIKVVVQLKSTASTYGYEIIADLVTIMLEFLELTNEFDADVIDLVEGHQKTLTYLVDKDAKHASSEEESKRLKDELYEACMRYRNKKTRD